MLLPIAGILWSVFVVSVLSYVNSPPGSVGVASYCWYIVECVFIVVVVVVVVAIILHPAGPCRE